METLMRALENIQNIIYKVIVWAILIPKTLLKIVLEPSWAPGYINSELNKGESRFDEFFSPIMLLLVVALVPYLVWSFIPASGVKVSSPTNDKPSVNNATDTTSAERMLDFNAEIRFVSTASTGYITTFWRVEKEDFIVGNYFYPIQSLKRHTNNPKEVEKCLQTPLNKPNFQSRQAANCLVFTPPTPTDYVEYDQIDSHTVQDSFGYEFSIPGSYYIVVTASKFDDRGNQIETYTDEIFVDVPKNKEDAVSIYTKSRPAEDKFSFKNVANQFENERTVFLALGMLIPPLLFALVFKLLNNEGPTKDITEDSLKEVFYVQCYYFSPLALMFWATGYARRFITPDVFYWFDTRFKLIVFLPLLLAFIWFVFVQAEALSKREMKIKGEKRFIKGWPAFLIVMGCVIVLALVILLIIYGSAPVAQEGVRKFSIWLYPLLAASLLAYHILSSVTRTKDKKPLWTGVIVALVYHIMLSSVTRTKDEKSPAVSVGGDSGKREQFNSSMYKFLSSFIKLSVLITFIMILASGQSPRLSSQNFDAAQQSFATAHSVKYIGTIEIQTLTAIPPSTLFPATVTELPANFSQDTPTIPSNIPTNTQEIPTSSPSPIRPSPTSAFTATPVQSSSTQNVVSSAPPSDMFAATATIAAALTQIAGFTTTVISTSTALPSTGGGGGGAPVSGQQLYVDEFTGKNLDVAWTGFVTLGDENLVNFDVNDGKLSINIAPGNDAPTWFYLLNTDFTNADVQIETTANNNGSDVNGVGLICRATSAGWYEFNVSNSGLYTIYAYDGTYNVLESGKLEDVIPNSDPNIYIAICNGNDLELWVNDSAVATTQDDRFTDGYTGLSVSSPKGLPVSTDFEYLRVGQP